MKTHKITVYGPGCAYCTTLAENVRKAVQKLPGSFEVDKITDPLEIAEAGVVQTPALALDDRILSNGKVLSVEQVCDMLRVVATADAPCCREGEADTASETEVVPGISRLVWISGIFAVLFFMPLESAAFQTALQATLDIAKWYAQEHVVLCLLPAFFIAGITAVFVSKGAVMRYLGAGAPKWLSYSVAAVSGGLLSVCSCTVLPLFTSIHKRGAGLGPAMAFLYSGPAISMITIILTARILGAEMGVARTLCAIGFSVGIGIIMSCLFRREAQQRPENAVVLTAQQSDGMPVHQVALLFFSLVAVLIFANWAPPQSQGSAASSFVYDVRWYLVAIASCMTCLALVAYLHIPLRRVLAAVVATVAATVLSCLYIQSPLLVAYPPMLVALSCLVILLLRDEQEHNRRWVLASWDFAVKMLPLMALGVLVTGFLLGSFHGETSIPGIIPAEWVQQAVGGNGLLSCFCASFAGAFMYFSSLTEIPIVQGLMSSGMGKGPALALLLAGPSLSLPNMLVLGGVMGWRKTVVYVSLVIVLSTICGYIYGNLL